MRLRLPILALTVLALAACAEQPAAEFNAASPTFPSRSEGMQDHWYQKTLSACREAADPNDPDCSLRVKSHGDQCRSFRTPAVIQTEIEYDKWTAGYVKCLHAK